MAVDRPAKPPSLKSGVFAVGSEITGCTLLGVLIDYLTNGWPWGTVGLTLFGFAIAMFHLTRYAKSFTKPDGIAT
ncbi:MAG TPA: hypothetical protein VGJ05_01450 [Fimbriiglobus sp.]|jgi:F0F1-type ATP synthase assembly protein I